MQHNEKGMTFVVLAALVVVGLSFYEHGFGLLDQPDVEWFHGTWTDEAGPAGNSIRLFLQEIDLPDNPTPITLLEGKAVFKNLFGADEHLCNWNFESCQPLRLNLNGPGGIRFARLEKIDGDHMFVLMTGDHAVASSPDWKSNPQTRRFKRVGVE